MTIEEMDYEIEKFINQYWGTAIGASVYSKRSNTLDSDFDKIEDIYNEIIEI